MITVSAAPEASGSAYMSPWRSSAASSPASASLARARRSISGLRSMPSACSAAGPNNSSIRPVPVPMSTRRPIGALAKRAATRRLDLALGDVERAQRVPIGGVAGEIALGGGGAVGAHRGEPGGVGGGPGIVAVELGPAVDELEQAARSAARGPRLRNTQLPFLAALGEAGVDQDLDVARDARLALAEHLGELADAKAPWRAAASGSAAGSGSARAAKMRGAYAIFAGYKDIFISGSRRSAARLPPRPPGAMPPRLACRDAGSRWPLPSIPNRYGREV